MKVLRNRVLIIFCLFTFLSIIIAKASVNQTKIISILMPAPFAESTSEVIEKFNKENNNNILIHVTKGPRETESVSDLAISSLLLGNSPYDLILIDVTWLSKYAKAGWLEPLESLVSEEHISGLNKGAKVGNYYGNSLYRLPFVADIGLLFWRTDLMDKPPRTPAELTKISRELQTSNKVKYGYVWQGRQYEGLSCVFLEIVNGFGGSWLDEMGNAHLDNKKTIEAVQWLTDLINNDISPKAVTNYSEPEALQAFESGEAAFMRNWPYAWNELQKSNSSVRGKVGVTTMVSKQESGSTSTLGSWGLSLLRNSKNKKEAIEVMNFLTSEKVQKHLFLKYGYTPTSNSVFSDSEVLLKAPIVKSLENALEKTKPRPQTALYAQISDVLQRGLSEAITGQNNVESAMNKAQLNTIKILKSAGSFK